MKKYLLALSLLLNGIWAVAQSNNPILFTVDKNPTYNSEFVYLFKKNHSNSNDFTEARVNEYLDLFVNFKLKITEAHKRGYDTTTKFIKELKTYSDELKKPYRAEKDLLDKLTKEAYDRFTHEVKAAHILILLKADATPDDTLKAYNKIADIKKRVLAGEDFEKLAKELSEDPSAKVNSGNLGYFTALQMVYPFEEGAYNTKIGEISPIIRTRYGYHIIKVLDKKDSRGQVEVSHILLRTSKGNEAKVKDKIFEIYDQLKSGRSWDELCKESSEDTNTKNSGGRLRPFGLNDVKSVPEFEAAAFALQKPGEISDPFQSSIGWHIIRLEKKIPVPPYEEAGASLRKLVARDERLKFSEHAAELKRKKDLGFLENTENKKRILTSADTILTNGRWKYAGVGAPKDIVLFSINKINASAEDFFQWVSKNQKSKRKLTSALMNQLYNSFTEEKINEAEEEKIIKENPDFRHLMTEYREGILLFEIMEKEIWNKASEDTVGQKKFYNENLDKYKAGPRVEARIFSTTDKSFLEEVKKKIANRDTLTAADMKKFKSVQNFRNYEKGDSKVIGKINWVPGLQDTEIDGVYYLVEVARLVDAGTKKFSEAKAQVISGYQDSLEKNWVASLKKKYPVKVNSKSKSAIMQELVKK